MDAKLFDRLVSSMQEMDEIVRGERASSREFNITPVEVRAIRKSTGLSEARFAKVMHVAVGTLKNWEQGHRDPTGPAKALLHGLKSARNPLRCLVVGAGGNRGQIHGHF